jgi:hypothetical protein
MSSGTVDLARELASRVLALLPGEAAARLRVLRGLIDLLECECSRSLGEFDKRAGFESSGAVDSVAWLRNECKLSGGAAAERLKVARGLEKMPQTAEAFASGEIGYQHAAVLARAAQQLGGEAVARLEAELLPKAAEVDPGRLVQLSQEFQARVNEEAFAKDAQLRHERRRLSLYEASDGMFVLEGRLDSEGGAQVKVSLEALMRLPKLGDKRTAEQHRADALVELAQDRGGNKSRPELICVASVDALRKEAEAEPGMLDWRLPIPQETLRRLSCDCSLTPVVTDESGDPLYLGRSRRTISPQLRKALALRDCGCAFPGCNRPARWTSGHHLKHWLDGGTTDKANTALLCDYHHWLMHEGGWRLRWGEDGKLEPIPPIRPGAPLSAPLPGARAPGVEAAA